MGHRSAEFVGRSSSPAGTLGPIPETTIVDLYTTWFQSAFGEALSFVTRSRSIASVTIQSDGPEFGVAEPGSVWL
jgi:hypothetical protein